MAYRGMSGCSLDFDGEIYCDDVMTGGTPTPQQIAAGMPVSAPMATNGISAWIQTNKTAVYLGSAALVALAIFGGRRR